MSENKAPWLEEKRGMRCSGWVATLVKDAEG